ncbi:unnamed protein product [Paramecium primaurelia]|uniref:Transmembrane protein n=1 Tax=Paramecium primaurelia TaxID=5886 RepID=A0A8S1KBV7_PARPR|nr:unnamed protein product [Paramecium primaurelia]
MLKTSTIIQMGDRIIESDLIFYFHFCISISQSTMSIFLWKLKGYRLKKYQKLEWTQIIQKKCQHLANKQNEIKLQKMNIIKKTLLQIYNIQISLSKIVQKDMKELQKYQLTTQ